MSDSNILFFQDDERIIKLVNINIAQGITNFIKTRLAEIAEVDLENSTRIYGFIGSAFNFAQLGLIRSKSHQGRNFDLYNEIIFDWVNLFDQGDDCESTLINRLVVVNLDIDDVYLNEIVTFILPDGNEITIYLVSISHIRKCMSRINK